MISLGCSTWYLRQLPLEQALFFIKQAGFSYAEISSEQLLLHSSDPLAIGSTARKLGLKLTWHAPHYDLNLTSRNPKMRDLALNQIIESMHNAHQARAVLLVLHPGRKTFTADTAKPYWQWHKQALMKISKKAVELELLVGLELMERSPRELVDSPESAQQIMSWGIPNLGLTVDLAHLRTWGPVDVMWQSLQNQWIYHLHISDSAPRASHLCLGQGVLDLPQILKKIKKTYQGPMILEGPSGLSKPQELVESMSLLKKWMV